MLKCFGQEHLRYTRLLTNVHGGSLSSVTSRHWRALHRLLGIGCIPPPAAHRVMTLHTAPVAGPRMVRRGDNGRTKELRTTVNAGGSGGGRQKWQMDTDRGAMAQQAVDLNPTLVIIYDPVHCG
jgi:hypothetical protein